MLSVVSWAVVISVSAFEIQRDEFKTVGVSTICELFGCLGLVLIGTYELDPFNKTMQILHYIGAAIGVLTVAGYGYQQYHFAKHFNNAYFEYLWLPCLLSVTATVCFFLWQYYGKKAQAYAQFVSQKRNNQPLDEMQNKSIQDEEIKQNVTKLSMQNVVSEAIFLFCGALSMCLYILNMEACFTDLGRNCY